MSSLLALAAAVAVLAVAGVCSAHYHSDLGSLLHFRPYEPAVNEQYPQLGCVSASASWADLQARFPVNTTRFEGEGSMASSCEALARAVKESFHPSQLLRNRPVLPWPAPGMPGGVPKALCRMGRNVTYADFLALPKKAPQKDAHWLRHYRVLRGRLYVNGTPSGEGYEEQLLMAVYLYDIPDMDLWLSHGDVAIAQGPLLQYAMDLRADVSGCSMPYFAAWRDSAFTLQQSMTWAACIAHRYPRAKRRKRAVWRGSTTDTFIHDINLANALALARVRLHMLGLVHSDVLDVKVTGVVQASSGVAELGTLLGVHANGMGFEGFQSYASVLDIDGNSFSRRMQQLVQMGGPVLKQASPFPSYFEHLFAPGVMPILRFANNLTDVAQQAKELLEAVGQEPRPNKWDDAVDNMHAVAAITLNRWSMVESVAYSINEIARHNSWVPTHAVDFTIIPWTKCCVGGGGLPDELIAAMHAAETIEGPLTAALYSTADNASAAGVLATYAAVMSWEGASSRHGQEQYVAASHRTGAGSTQAVAAFTVALASLVALLAFVFVVVGQRFRRLPSSVAARSASGSADANQAEAVRQWRDDDSHDRARLLDVQQAQRGQLGQDWQAAAAGASVIKHGL